MKQTALIARSSILSGLMLGLMSGAASTALMAADINIDTEIKGVKVYRNAGAVVTRTGVINASAGDHTVTVRGLPVNIDQNYGVRARLIDGSGNITQVKLDEQFTEGTNTEAQRKIIEQIEGLEAETRNDQSKIEALNIQLSFIEAMGQRTAGNSNDGTFETLERTLSFVAEKSSKIITERKSLNEAITKRAAQIQALRRELNQTGNLQKSFNEATITLSKSAPSDATLELTYLTNNANWTLEADASLNSDSKQATINMFAVIQQNSGEDWTNVPLSLSTTQISRRLSINTPYPVYYNLSDPKEREIRRLKSVAMANDSLEREEVVVSGPRLVNERLNAAPRFNQSNFDAEFAINTPTTITSGGTQQRIQVASNTSDAALHIRTTPAYGNDAFLYATAEFDGIPTISNPSVSVIRDGNYVGRGTWPDLEASKKLYLPFGSYDRIDVKTVILPTEDGKSGIFSKRRVDEERKQYIVTNNHNAPLSVEVYGVMPQSLNEDIEIETLRGSTDPTEINIEDKPGVVVWRKILNAGEVWTINHWLRTSYPADMRLTGK